MTWNYRVIREKDTLSIRDVFYDSQDMPASCGATPVTLTGADSVTELRDDLFRMLSALEKPILDIKVFEHDAR